MTKTPLKGESPTIFISYASRDRDILQKLHNSLEMANIHTWVDRESISIGSEWEEDIDRAIRTSDAMLFVVSPDSLKSKACANELEIGYKYNKKIIPIIYREPVRSSTLEEKFPDINNWIFLREKDEFDEAINQLTEKINLDLEWVRTQTYLMERAKEWERSKKKKHLLGKSELETATRWMSEAIKGPNLQITPIEFDYILASQEALTERRYAVLISSILVAIFVAFLILQNVSTQILNITISKILFPLSILIAAITLLFLAVRYYIRFRESQSYALSQQLLSNELQLFQNIDLDISQLITREASNGKA